MISVCHLTSVHPPFDVRIFYKECVSLSKAGYNVILIAPINQKTIKQGVTVVPVSVPKSRLKRIILAPLRMFLLALKQKADIYHFHDAELMLTGILLRICGKKVIYDIHENNRLNILDKEYLGFFSKYILYFGYIIFEKTAILFYNKLVLALSQETFSKYYSPKKSVVILNFPLYRPRPNVQKQITMPVKFVYAGVVHPTRGIIEMLNIIIELKKHNINSTLDIIGIVRPENYINTINNIIISNNIQNNVKLHGFVDASKVNGYIKDAHFGLVFLYPFKRYVEALPTKMFEYMQNGLPVITNNYWLYTKYVEQTNTGLCIDVNNLNTEIEKLISLINNTNQIKLMSQNGIELTQSSFNWVSQQKKLLSLYKSLHKY